MAAAPPVPLSPLWWVNRLYARLNEQRKMVDFFDAYYRGDHPLPWLAPQARDEFRRILAMTRSNYMGLVVDATAERLQVEGFRLGADTEQADADTWRIWQANNLDSDSDQGILEAIIARCSYMQVAPNPDDPPTPHMWLEHPSQAIVEYVPGTNRRRRAASLKAWDDDWTQEIHITLQVPGHIYKYRTSRPKVGGSVGPPEWVERDVEGEQPNGRRTNPLGVVSMVELPNNPRLLTGGVSELADVTDIQDRINKTLADRLITQDYGAFPQKWAVAWPNEDEDGTPNTIDGGRNRMVTTEVKETKFGQWDAAPMDPYSLAKREDVKDIASRTRTPAQYLLGEMSNVNGEAAALDTPVPTPRGLVPIGEVRDGDSVYDERGQVQVVQHAHPVLHGRPCARITFDEGTSFIVDENHRWAVVSIAEDARHGAGIAQRTERSVLSTREIRGSLMAANGQNVHAIDLADATDMPEVDLLIDPYVLGVYLGDGGVHHGSISSCTQDLDAMTQALTDTGAQVSARQTRPGDYLLTVKGMRGQLIELGLLKSAKRIPEIYFTASAKQRLALLQGLMDTDGTTSCRHANTVALDLHDGGLAHDARRLACSLGHKVSLRQTPFTKTFPGGAVVSGTRYRMRWCPPDVVFRLPRKVEAQARQYLTGKGIGAARPKVLRRTIVAVEPVTSVPVRCLTVSGPSHLFLIGAEHVPTHNTLKASESGLVSKVRQRQRTFAEGIEAAVRLARRAAGLPDAGDAGVETIWRNPEFRTEGELTDSVVKKLQTGIASLRQAREDVGYSASQISRMEADDAIAATDPVLERIARNLTGGGAGAPASGS